MRFAYGVTVAMLAATQAFAQQHTAPLAGNDPLAAHLFPPELIMAHQREIDLQDAQRMAQEAHLRQV